MKFYYNFIKINTIKKSQLDEITKNISCLENSTFEIKFNKDIIQLSIFYL